MVPMLVSISVQRDQIACPVQSCHVGISEGSDCPLGPPLPVNALSTLFLNQLCEQLERAPVSLVVIRPATSSSSNSLAARDKPV